MFTYDKNRKTVNCPFNNYRPINSDLTVRNGLAVTPSQMADMTRRGISISTANLDFLEGSLNPSSEVPVEQARGVDVNDVWQASQTAKKKLKAAHVRDIQTYGE